jgi:FkbM family methyltransferase
MTLRTFTRPRAGASPQALPLFDLQRLVTHSRGDNEAAIRGMAYAVPLPNDVVLCRTLGRHKIHVDARDEGLSPHLMLDGFWEMWVTQAIPHFLRRGMVAWDVGANVGYFTLLCADLVGPGGIVHACEPNQRLAWLLTRSASLNGFGERIRYHLEPLSDFAGQPVAMQVDEYMPQNGIAVPAPESPGALRTTTFDELVGNGPADFIKIDADGAEFAIWSGMRQLIARQQPLSIFLEFTPDRYEHPAGFLQEMLDASFALGIADPTAGIIPVGLQGVLNHAPPHIDRMLILAR